MGIKGIFLKKILFIAILFLVKISNAAPFSKPDSIIIGVYPMMFHNFNYAANSFDINFYLWTITKIPNYDPKSSLEIINALKYDIRNLGKGLNKDGSYYTTLHYYATCRYNWDVSNFPFDRQLLRIDIEDSSDTTDVVFKPDYKDSNIPVGLKIQGWNILKFYIKVQDSLYNSNLGDLAFNKVKYSQFSFFIDIKRKGARLFVNYFIGFFTSFVLCILIFVLRPNEIGKRINLSLGSIFPAVGNKYILDNFLPPVNQFTLSDAIQLSTFGMILVANIVTVITFELTNHGKPTLANKINRAARYIVTPFFTCILFFFLIKALIS